MRGDEAMRRGPLGATPAAQGRGDGLAMPGYVPCGPSDLDIASQMLYLARNGMCSKCAATHWEGLQHACKGVWTASLAPSIA